MLSNVLSGPSDHAAGSRRTQSPHPASTLPHFRYLKLGPFKGTFNDQVVWGVKLFFLGLLTPQEQFSYVKKRQENLRGHLSQTSILFSEEESDYELGQAEGLSLSALDML